MEIFYTENIAGDFITLNENETRHAIQVLRYQIGDQLMITDGKGQLYQAILIAIEKRSCTAKIESTQVISTPTPAIHIAVGITKQSDRWEWMLEKLTELGITTITPIITHRTEKQKVNSERLHKVMLAALKQSGGGTLPILNPAIKWDNFLKLAAISPWFIAHNEGENLTSFTNYFPLKSSTTIAIGPEGGFTADEVSEAIQHGANAVLLGNRRLRVETAAITAVAAIRLANHRD